MEEVAHAQPSTTNSPKPAVNRGNFEAMRALHAYRVVDAASGTSFTIQEEIFSAVLQSWIDSHRASPTEQVLEQILSYFSSAGSSSGSENPYSVKNLIPEAENGGALAQTLCGLFYKYGFGVPTNYAQAEKWLRKGAEQNVVSAQYGLGLLYGAGLGSPGTGNEAVVWWRRAAESGSEYAQFELGVRYLVGRGVPTNDAEAYKWFDLADSFGFGAVRSLLGETFEESGDLFDKVQRGIEAGLMKAEASSKLTRDQIERAERASAEVFSKIPDRAKETSALTIMGAWRRERGTADTTSGFRGLQKAAKLGCAEAQYRLASFYDYGIGVAKDQAEAAKRYREAAAQGDTRAQWRLGEMCWRGEGVSRDNTEAMKWWRRAAEQGHAEAQATLGYILQEGEVKHEGSDIVFNPGIVRDPEESAKWSRKAAGSYRKLAEGGDLDALEYLGRAFSQGLGVPKDAEQSTLWYHKLVEVWKKKAQQGDADAQVHLGSAYQNGSGVPQDPQEAFRWFHRAANQGKITGQMFLGSCYAEGRGVAQDFIEAYKWYNLGSAQTDSIAQFIAGYRDTLAEKMTREQIAEAQRRSSRFVPKKENPDTARAVSPSATPSEEQAPQSSGSGFFVTEDGYLVTSFHVVEGAGRIVVKTKKGMLPANLINADKVNDVAVLKVDGTFPALPVAPSRGTKLGETILTIGFPNTGLQGFAPKLTKGEISSLTGAQDDPRELQISVAVQPGNSGGPLVNQYGNVVGIVEARLADIATLKSTGSLPQNVNYAVKSSVLSVLLESLPEISSKLEEPYPPKDRKFEDVVKETESATVLVLVY